MNSTSILAVVALVLAGSDPGVSPTSGTDQAAAAVAQVEKQIEESKAPDKLRAFAIEKLLPQVTNPVWVNETIAQNGKHVALDEIKQIDLAWREAEEELPIHREILANACALEIKRFANATPAVSEAFVMDNQGALVGTNMLISDYWQGDEAKWSGSYNDGRGGVNVGDERFDRSANASLQQISLPLVSPDGAIVGAITFGISVERL